MALSNAAVNNIKTENSAENDCKTLGDFIELRL